MALRDLLVRLGIQVDGQENLKKTDQSLRQVLYSAQQFGTQLRRLSGYLVIGAVIRSVKNFVEEQITMADQLQHNAERLGLTTDELQKYQYVAGLMQVSTKETAVALRFFNRAVGEAALGTKAANKVFGQLGVTIRDSNGQVKPTDELLFEVADKLKGVHSQAIRTAYAMRLLGRNGASMLPVLQKGGEELRKAFADVDELGGGFNEQFVKQAHETDVLLKRLKMGWRSVFVAIATEVLPVLNRLTQGSIRTVKWLIYMAKHTYGFRTALATLAAGTLFFAIYRLMKLFGIGKVGLTDIFSFFVKYPIIALFTAAVVALYLAFDDLYTFLKGGDSMIGRFLDHLGGAGTALTVWQELKGAVIAVWEALKPAGDALKNVGKDIISAFVETIPSIVKWGSIFGVYVISVIDTAVTRIRQFATLLTALSGNENALKEAGQIGNDQKEREEEYQRLVRAFDSITNPPVNAAAVAYAPGGPMFSGPPPMNIEITNNITGATDPQATGRAVGRATKGAVTGAINRNTYYAVSAGQPSTGQ